MNLQTETKTHHARYPKPVPNLKMLCTGKHVSTAITAVESKQEQYVLLLTLPFGLPEKRPYSPLNDTSVCLTTPVNH